MSTDKMNPSTGLMMDAAEIQRVIRAGLPSASNFSVEEVRDAFVRIRLAFEPWMLRPGNLVSGPALFTAADAAMYALVMAHRGPLLMAVTTDMTLHFLNAAPAGDVVAEASMLRLGQRMAVMEVSLHTGPERTFAAHVTGTYALPRPRAPKA